jgi:hypothetical protein
MVYGVCRDAFVNSAAQIIVNLNKIAPHGLTCELDKQRRGWGLSPPAKLLAEVGRESIG